MNPYLKKFKNLSRLKPSNKYSPIASGYCTREYLSTIFAEYVKSYQIMASEEKAPIGTIMFIFKNYIGSDTKPHATTIKISTYDIKNMEAVVKKIKIHFPRDTFSLEMILYTRVPDDFNKNKDIYFGAIDCGGATTYTIYTYLNKKLTKKKKSGLDNVWIPPISKTRKLPFTPIEDKFLKDLMVLYHVSSLNETAISTTSN